MTNTELQERVRAVTRHIPFRAGATLFNVVLSTLGRDGHPPNWRVSEGVGDYPAMELNVSSPFQRRMFYFPRAYWERLMGLPFGRFMSSTLQEGQVFLDIGANIGFYTLFAARRVGPKGRVYSFEPDPMTYESLTRSVGRNQFDWVRCINAALSDREGTMPFFTVSDGSAHSLVPEIERRANRYSGQVPVRVTRLDDLDREGLFDVPTIDLIKIDVEGEEPRTVAGMLKTLERFHYPSVWAEVRGPQGSTRAPNTYPRVERELRSLGYTPLQWKNGNLRDVKTHDIRGREDVLFRFR
jgi:FkbM family methyltransferase